MVIAAAIGLVALLYASVGQAGATGYIAVLALAGFGPETIKPASLCLNVAVAAVAALRFTRASRAAWAAFLPFAALGVPLSAVGGTLNLPAHAFRLVTGALLAGAGGYMAWSSLAHPRQQIVDLGTPTPEALAVGSAIGFLSGVIGFGGGILLAPWLLFRRRTSALTTAGLSALFNLFNSAAGVAGAWSLVIRQPSAFGWWLLAAVGGGWFGAVAGSRYLPAVALRLILSVLLVASGLKLLLT